MLFSIFHPREKNCNSQHPKKKHLRGKGRKREDGRVFEHRVARMVTSRRAKACESRSEVKSPIDFPTSHEGRALSHTDTHSYTWHSDIIAFPRDFPTKISFFFRQWMQKKKRSRSFVNFARRPSSRWILDWRYNAPSEYYISGVVLELQGVNLSSINKLRSIYIRGCTLHLLSECAFFISFLEWLLYG